MNNASTAPPKSRNSRFIPFFLILVVAVAIGFTIRHFKEKPFATTEERSWEVYFSKVNGGAKANSLESRLVAKLGLSAERIDAALYDLDSVPVTDALINAHNRGVKVRVLTENDNVDEAEIKRLQKAGVPVRDDGDNDGYMHHKFLVIDGRYVWTGSYNTTYNGAYKNNNNVVWIDSEPLAYNFTQEFREMYVLAEMDRSSDPHIPFPHITLNDGTQISTYFAPENDTISPLLKEIKSARKSIYFMVFSFTHDKLGKAMRDRFKLGVTMGGVFDESGLNAYSEYEPMKKAGISVRVDRSSGAMHHKVIVIDDETVITGSYNFSKNAEARNSENLLIIKGNKDIARAYLDEFNRLKW
jgi:phosphatidylserine/phosphatidylglycerophosphate/cardiolipin synthase-like enzyme